jgi:maltooligosyltrehalose synthase
MVVVVPRLVLGLTEGQQRLPLGPEVWGDTCLQIPGSKPHQRFRNILTGQEHFTPEEKTDFAVAEILSCFPVALLERVG